MSDKINELVAEKVMGWSRGAILDDSRPYFAAVDAWFASDDDEEPICRDFSPSTNMPEALQVVGRITLLGHTGIFTPEMAPMEICNVALTAIGYTEVG